MIAVEQQPIMCIISYSRCLYCGRRTPHEVCHEHSSELHPEGIALPEGWNTENERAVVSIRSRSRDMRRPALPALGWPLP